MPYWIRNIILMLITYLKQCLLIILIIASPYKSLTGSNLSKEVFIEKQIDEVVIKPKKSHNHHSGTFLGFKLEQTLNTRISNELTKALLSYTGPKVTISSLRRFGTRSKHCCGKAVDFAWKTELIDYLVSPEGTAWRECHNLTFYIEAKPKDSILLPYKKDENYKQYVFENPKATGPHIHLNLKH